jgi:hypothetical protein
MAGILKVDQVQSDSNLAFAIAGSNVAFMNATSLQMVGSNVSLAGTNVITNGKLVTAGMPVGTVLQVVSAQPVNLTSTTANAVLTSLSITPSNASSRILLFGSVEGERNGGTTGNYIFGQLRKNTTNIRQFMNAAGYQQTTGARNYNNVMYIDSPATTSAITYDLWVDHTTTGAASGITWGWYSASIHALEIAS